MTGTHGKQPEHRDDNPYSAPQASPAEAGSGIGLNSAVSIVWYSIPLFCLTFALACSFAIRHPAFGMQPVSEVWRCMVRAMSYTIIGTLFHSWSTESFRNEQKNIKLRIGSALVFATVPFLLEQAVLPDIRMAVSKPFATVVSAMIASYVTVRLLRRFGPHPDIT